MSETRDPKYSWVFQKLTEDDQGQYNLESIVAYTIYKKQKIKFIDDTKVRKGREPNNFEWESFHTNCESDASLEMYRSQAREVVAELLEITLSDQISALEDQALLDSKVKSELELTHHKLDSITTFINGRQGAKWWWSEVGKNSIVNIATIFFLGGVATLIINFNKISAWFTSFFS